MTIWLPGMRMTAGRLNDGLSPVTTSAGLVVATGFSLNNFSGYKLGRMVVLDIYLARTGADITVSGGSNITPDVLACTVPTGWRPTSQTINGGWDNGVVEGGFVLGTDGLCTLRTSTGTITGTAGTGVSNLRFHTEFIID